MTLYSFLFSNIYELCVAMIVVGKDSGVSSCQHLHHLVFRVVQLLDWLPYQRKRPQSDPTILPTCNKRNVALSQEPGYKVTSAALDGIYVDGLMVSSTENLKPENQNLI